MTNQKKNKLETIDLLRELGHKMPLSDAEIIRIFVVEIRRLQMLEDMEGQTLREKLLGENNGRVKS